MKANIFQIFHDEAGRGQLDPGFDALDNSASPKPDWREYWAIRNFFQSGSVNEDELYGFVSTDFGEKTGLTAQAVHQFIGNNPGHEAYTFSPSTQESACYLNVFEHGNRLNPGFIELAEAFVREIQLDVDLRTLAMDARSTVYRNHIVAKPSFWQTWFALTEKLFELVEDEQSAFRRQIDSTALVRHQLAIKILLLERIASLVLTLCPDIDVCAFDAKSMPLTNPAYRPYEQQLAMLGELKDGFVKTGDKAYLDNFNTLRGTVLQAGEGSRLSRAKSGFLSTPLKASPDLLYVCFTHVPTFFDYPPFVQMLCLGDAQGPGKANLRDLAPEWEPFHPQLGATVGAFALKNYIVENGLQVRQVGICQYRKFVSAKQVSSVPVSNYTSMDAVSRKMIEETALADVMLPGDRDIVLARLGVVNGGYLNQYKDAHLVEDFLRFTSEAVELGVLSRGDVVPFFNSDAFMPGGIELGVFPTEFWVPAMTAIEAVIRACLSRYPYKREGHQARVWSFCAERLGSFLLLRHICSRYGVAEWEAKFAGRLNLVSADDQSVYVAGR
jgi:hypothetical protein